MDAIRTVAEQVAGRVSHTPAWRRVLRLTTRTVWLPRQAYRAVPWIYLAGGACCLLSGLYQPEGSWILPYLALLGLLCLHAGLLIASWRRRPRAAGAAAPGRAPVHSD